MALRALRYLDPVRWKRQIERIRVQRESRRLRKIVEAEYTRQDGIGGGDGPRTIVAEGLWDNPNHWFRLRLFLKALPETDDCRLVGILRSQGDKAQRRSLEVLGFRRFIYIDEKHPRDAEFDQRARELLRDVHTHADLLRIDLPHGLPAYVFYDTVLKKASHPRPPLSSPLWHETLRDALRYLAIYDDLFEQHDVCRVIASHGWKNEYGALVWLSVRHHVAAYHLTGYTDGFRIHRHETTDGYQRPVEHLSYDRDFLRLPQDVRTRIFDEGAAYLDDRMRGASTDINVRRANLPDRRIMDRTVARHAMGVTDDRPLAVVYAHAWHDFPHIFGMKNFTDFQDWIEFTVAHAKQNTNVHWLFKPHPLEEWHGSTRLADIVDDSAPNIDLCAIETDTITTQNAAEIAVTVHGTVGPEAVARGAATICADRNYYSDWGITYLARSREHYAQLLATAQSLPRPTEEQRRLAMAVAGGRFAPAPEGENLLRTECDSTLPNLLYENILHLLSDESEAIENEVKAIHDWLASGHSSYSVFVRLRHHGAF